MKFRIGATPAMPSSQGLESSFMREYSALAASSQTESSSALMVFAQHSGTGSFASTDYFFPTSRTVVINMIIYSFFISGIMLVDYLDSVHDNATDDKDNVLMKNKIMQQPDMDRY